jgi:CelD/BcsL family acetyltransferase involved in cellulose biosynthesis
MLAIRLVRADDLDSGLIAAWRRIQSCCGLDSPYFWPEFTQAVAAVRSDVEIAVLEQAGEPVGFFPFQRGPLGIGKPVGGRLSDLHGVLALPDVEWDCVELLRRCRLTAWDFDHLPAAQQRLAPAARRLSPAPFIDLSAGFDIYCRARHAAGARHIEKLRRYAQRLIRRHGPPRFEHTTDRGLLDALVRLKSEQYRRTGLIDTFQFPWTIALLQRLLAQPSPDFRGVLFVMYVGDEVAAVEYDLRAGDVLHSWFPAYDPQFARDSPGLLLLLEVARMSPELGIRRIDLGKGDQEYKQRFATGAEMLAEGSITVNSATRWVRQGWRTTKNWLRRLPGLRQQRGPARWAFHLREWMEFR